MITLLVVAGIALLIAIGYINHVVENNKLERARTKVELNDRLRRCGEITETFPGQLMTPALKLLLTRLELNVCQRLLNLEKTSANLKARITELEALVAQGQSIPVNNPPAPIQTEAKAKDVRFLLEALHGQITRAAQDGFLPPNEAKGWIREVRHILVLLHIEFFNNLGQHSLQQNQPGAVGVRAWRAVPAQAAGPPGLRRTIAIPGKTPGPRQRPGHGPHRSGGGRCQPIDRRPQGRRGGCGLEEESDLRLIIEKK